MAERSCRELWRRDQHGGSVSGGERDRVARALIRLDGRVRDLDDVLVAVFGARSSRLAARSLPWRIGSGRSRGRLGPAYMAMSAAVAPHTASRLARHMRRGNTGRQWSTAFGAVAVWTSRIGASSPTWRWSRVAASTRSASVWRTSSGSRWSGSRGGASSASAGPSAPRPRPVTTGRQRAAPTPSRWRAQPAPVVAQCLAPGRLGDRLARCRRAAGHDSRVA